MSKYLLSLIIISSILIGSCTKEELQYQNKSTNLFTYYVSTEGGDAEITYYTKSKLNTFIQKDATWHTTINLNKGDTAYIRVYTETGCTLNMYTAYNGYKTYLTEDHYLQSFHKMEIAYIINE